jgi:predicted transcriptional regulator
MNKLDAWCQLLDKAKSAHSINSDAELARRLEVTRSYISALRVGRKNISIEVAEKLFELIGIEIREHVDMLFLPETYYKEGITEPQILVQRQYVLDRANGRCELCNSEAPFKLKDGSNYLEFSVIKQEEKKVEAALCPNCHKKLILLNSESDKQRLLTNIISKNS